MENHTKAFLEMQTIWDKLSSFRKNTEERAQKLLSELQEDKWIEKELLSSLADASHEMQELQESLLHTLSDHDIKAAPTAGETYDAVNAWERKELAKSIALEIGEVLKKVASLSYEGTEESIIADLEKIREEARSLLKDLEHYEKHQERIDAFKQLLSWVEAGKPLGFAEGPLCMKAFGYNLYFAINAKQLHLGTYEEENAAPAETEPTISVPECAFYHGELVIDALPVKQKLFKSATKFKNEMESMVSPKTSKAIDVLNLLIGHIALLPEYYESLCIPSRAKALFETLLEQVYQAGLARKISYYDTNGYILNRDLISYYKNDSYKRVLRYKSDSMLQDDEDISDVRYVRTLITLHMLNGMRKLYGNFGAHFDDEDEKNLGCCTAMFSISMSGDTPIHVGLMIPLFTKEHLSEEMKDIKEFLVKAENEETTVLICIMNEEEKNFWDKTLADYHIFRVFYSPVGTEFTEKFATDELKKIFAYYEEEHKKRIESQTAQLEETENKAETEDVLESVKEEARAEIPANFSDDSEEAEEKTAPEPMKEEESAEIAAKLSDEAEKKTVTKPMEAEESTEISAERSDEAEDETVPETVKEEEPAKIPAALSRKATEENTPEPVKQENTTEILANLSSEADEEPLDDMLTTIAREIRKHHIAEGMLMLHGLAMQKEEDWAYHLLSEVSYVLDDPLYPYITHKEDAYKYWDYTLDIPAMDTGNARDYLNAAAMIRYFFKPSHSGGNWHWQTNQVWKQISDDSSNTALQAIPEIKQVISCFYRFLDKNKRGLGWCLGSTGRRQERYEQDMALCHNELTALSQRLQHRKIKHHYHPRIIKTYEQICKGSDLYLYISMPEEASAEEILAYVNRFSDEAKPVDEIISDEELGYTVSGDKLDAWMDEVWASIEVDRKQTDHFTGAARSSLRSLLVCAFEALGKYVFTRLRMESKKEAQIEASVVKKTIEEATGLCTELIGRLPKPDPENAVNPLLEISICSLKYLVKALLKSFNSNYRPMEFYEPFLLTNYVELNEHYVPLMDFDYQLAGLSLYKRCLMHVKEIEEGKLDPSEISSYESSREYSKKHMNMGFYKLLSHRLGMEDTGIKEEEIDSKGENYLSREMENFRSELELSYNYGRLTQKNEIESYERLADLLRTHLTETQNFGLFTLFTAACKERIDKDSQPRKEDLEKQFASLKEMLAQKMADTHEPLSDYPILDEIRKCLENRNFNVAEDYMRQCQDGNLTEIKNLFNNELDDFRHFIESYQEYYNICSKNARVNLDKTLDSWLSYKRKSRSSLSKNAIGKGQIAFVQQWDRLLSSVGKVTPELFLEMLGYPKVLPSDVSVDKQTNNRPVYDVSFKGERVHKNSHPFKQFGSGIYEEGLKVITFTGAHTPETIMKELTDADVERAKGTICLLDASMKWADRCELAKLMKCNEAMYNVIVIDRVMALYLSQFTKLERENKMMRLCMPFANATPFLFRGFIPPEMFIGRTKELADIRNMEGPNLVYGGRQLGKSILLRQVSFLDNQPAKEHYAFYFDMKDKNETQVLETISKELKKAKLLDHILTDWDDFADSMDTMMEKAKQLILLIDEADAFILSSGKVKDRPIEVLRVTQNKFLGHFKFVLAGLHNVIRYDKGSLSANTVYGQLGHINIRPFEYADACDLLLRPLSYLGFTIPEPEIVSTILAKTNYFPGLIQYYGMKILESAKTAYRKNNFKSTENPPYVLNESYLKHLMEDDSFLREIEDKFMITLRVDKYDDNLYYLLTLGVAYLYAAEDKPVTLDKIKDTLSGTRIKNLTDDKLSALLDELEELNVLRQVNDSEYIFNRYSFYSMLGGAEKVEKALMEYADN